MPLPRDQSVMLDTLQTSWWECEPRAFLAPTGASQPIITALCWVRQIAEAGSPYSTTRMGGSVNGSSSVQSWPRLSCLPDRHTGKKCLEEPYSSLTISGRSFWDELYTDQNLILQSNFSWWTPSSSATSVISSKAISNKETVWHNQTIHDLHVSATVWVCLVCPFVYISSRQSGFWALFW